MSIGSTLLFVCGATHVKSTRMVSDVNREPLTFCTQRCMCKKYKMIRDVNQEPLADVFALVY
jgi:hypothetical protein